MAKEDKKKQSSLPRCNPDRNEFHSSDSDSHKNEKHGWVLRLSLCTAATDLPSVSWSTCTLESKISTPGSSEEGFIELFWTE
jgi:hypothetical protein